MVSKINKATAKGANIVLISVILTAVFQHIAECTPASKRCYPDDFKANGGQSIRNLEQGESYHLVRVYRNGIQICSGAMISYKVAITAAHCFDPFHQDFLPGADLSIYELVIGSGLDESLNISWKLRPHDRIITHPDYRNLTPTSNESQLDSYYNYELDGTKIPNPVCYPDLALIITEIMEISNDIFSLVLPSPGFLRNTELNSEFSFYGFGKISDKCAASIAKNISMTFDTFQSPRDECLFYAIGSEFGGFTQSGDSGGILVINTEDDGMLLVGILSEGLEHFTSKSRNLFTSLSTENNRNFIQQYLPNHSLQEEPILPVEGPIPMNSSLNFIWFVASMIVIGIGIYYKRQLTRRSKGIFKCCKQGPEYKSNVPLLLRFKSAETRRISRTISLNESESETVIKMRERVESGRQRPETIHSM